MQARFLARDLLVALSCFAVFGLGKGCRARSLLGRRSMHLLGLLLSAQFLLASNSIGSEDSKLHSVDIERLRLGMTVADARVALDGLMVTPSEPLEIEGGERINLGYVGVYMIPEEKRLAVNFTGDVTGGRAFRVYQAEEGVSSSEVDSILSIVKEKLGAPDKFLSIEGQMFQDGEVSYGGFVMSWGEVVFQDRRSFQDNISIDYSSSGDFFEIRVLRNSNSIMSVSRELYSGSLYRDSIRENNRVLDTE